MPSAFEASRVVRRAGARAGSRTGGVAGGFGWIAGAICSPVWVGGSAGVDGSRVGAAGALAGEDALGVGAIGSELDGFAIGAAFVPFSFPAMSNTLTSPPTTRNVART